MSSNWDALQRRLDGLKKPTATVTICDDPAARQRLALAKANAEEAKQALAGLMIANPDAEHRPQYEERDKAAKAELAAAQKAFDRCAVTLTFQALDRKEFDDLQKAHPATEQEEADGDDFHMATFGPALIAAASTDGMPEEYARHLLDTWTGPDAQALLTAAFSVQHQQRTDLGKG